MRVGETEKKVLRTMVRRTKVTMVVAKQAKPLSLYTGTCPLGVVGPYTVLPGKRRMMVRAKTEYPIKVQITGALGAFT